MAVGQAEATRRLAQTRCRVLVPGQASHTTRRVLDGIRIDWGEREEQKSFNEQTFLLLELAGCFCGSDALFCCLYLLTVDRYFVPPAGPGDYEVQKYGAIFLEWFC